MRNQRIRALLLVLAVLAMLIVAGCRDGTDDEATSVASLPTDTPIPPTNTATLEPTATATLEPTATNTPTPTNTPTNTPTSTPTDTPTPTATNTPLPPTETPTPTRTPRPANTPLPTSTNTPEPAAEPLCLVYRSNPAELLGCFPVRSFDANQLYQNMLNMRQALWTMRDALPSARTGDAAACGTYVGAYQAIYNSGVFYDPVPPEWQDVDSIYVLSFIFSLDRTRPAMLSCANAGTVDDFNANLAAQTIEQTLAFLQGGIDAAASRLP